MSVQAAHPRHAHDLLESLRQPTRDLRDPVPEGCEGCIAYHAAGAVRRGATEEEAAEALGVALLMQGGPASVHAPMALQTFREFARGDDT